MVARGATGSGGRAVALHAEQRERLRALIRGIESQPRSQPQPSRPGLADAPGAAVGPDAPALDALLPDVVRRETAEGACTYRERRYPLSHVVGEQPLAELRHARGDALALLAPGEGLERARPEELLFLDIETTGLGGAGAITFLVATGRLERGAFVLRQYLALSPAEEGALLEALIEDATLGAPDPVLVTYNGRAFDAPMLDQRATMHRRRGGFEALRHVDLLPPARLAYRGLLESCRLAVVEAELLGLRRPHDDVPGAEVPAWYFRYLRGGDARRLLPLIAHNELDVLALGGLLAWLAVTLTGVREPRGREALAAGRLLARRRRHDAARPHLRRALSDLPPSAARDEALARLAALYKTAGRRELAEPLWRELASEAGPRALRSHVELAIYYEHHLRDFARASAVVERALAAVEQAFLAHEAHRAERWRAQLLHRRRRLRSKQERARGASAPPA